VAVVVIATTAVVVVVRLVVELRCNGAVVPWAAQRAKFPSCWIVWHVSTRRVRAVALLLADRNHQSVCHPVNALDSTARHSVSLVLAPSQPQRVWHVAVITVAVLVTVTVANERQSKRHPKRRVRCDGQRDVEREPRHVVCIKEASRHPWCCVYLPTPNTPVPTPTCL